MKGSAAAKINEQIKAITLIESSLIASVADTADVKPALKFVM